MKKSTDILLFSILLALIGLGITFSPGSAGLGNIILFVSFFFGIWGLVEGIAQKI